MIRLLDAVRPIVLSSFSVAGYLVLAPDNPARVFLTQRFSKVRSATSAFTATAPARRSFTSPVLACGGVSPASRFLPASKNSFDRLQYPLWAIPSSRRRSAMLSAPQMPDSTFPIFSYEEYSLCVARRVSLVTCSAGAFAPGHGANS